MTKFEQHRNRSKSFIDGVIQNATKDYTDLMIDLNNQSENWKKEYSKLSYTNIFELTDEQYDRKNYLNALIDYSNTLLYKHKFNLHKHKFNKINNSEQTITIKGNNLSVIIS